MGGHAALVSGAAPAAAVAAVSWPVSSSESMYSSRLHSYCRISSHSTVPLPPRLSHSCYRHGLHKNVFTQLKRINSGGKDIFHKGRGGDHMRTRFVRKYRPNLQRSSSEMSSVSCMKR